MLRLSLLFVGIFSDWASVCRIVWLLQYNWFSHEEWKFSASDIAYVTPPPPSQSLVVLFEIRIHGTQTNQAPLAPSTSCRRISNAEGSVLAFYILRLTSVGFPSISWTISTWIITVAHHLFSLQMKMYPGFFFPPMPTYTPSLLHDHHL